MLTSNENWTVEEVKYRWDYADKQDLSCLYFKLNQRCNMKLVFNQVLISSLYFWQINQPLWVTSPCLQWRWIKNYSRKSTSQIANKSPLLINVALELHLYSTICMWLSKTGLRLYFFFKTLPIAEFDCTFTDILGIKTEISTTRGCLEHNTFRVSCLFIGAFRAKR